MIKKSKIYDLVCVGRKARRVAELVQNNSPQVYMTKLIIDNSCSQKQQMTYKINPFSREHQVQEINTCAIKSIDPINRTIHLANKQQIQYQQLVYSGYDKQWKDQNCIEGLEDILATPYNSVLSDSKSYQSLSNSLNGHVIVNIPKGRHFGYSNYFMFDLLKLKKQQFRKGITDQFKRRQFRLTIINQGKSFFPYQKLKLNQSQKINEKLSLIFKEKEERLRQLIKRQNIELIQEQKVEVINSREKKVKITSNQWRTFDSFYQFLPFKNSQIIEGVDPIKVNFNTLNHLEFPEIFFLANNLPFIQSNFSTYIKQEYIAQNVVNSHISISRKKYYQGQTIFPIYNNKNNVQICAVDSNGALKLDRFGSQSSKQLKILQFLLKFDQRFSDLNSFNKINSFLLAAIKDKKVALKS